MAGPGDPGSEGTLHPSRECPESDQEWAGTGETSWRTHALPLRPLRSASGLSRSGARRSETGTMVITATTIGTCPMYQGRRQGRAHRRDMGRSVQCAECRCHLNPAVVEVFVSATNWRRDRDSNPGGSFPPTRVPGVRLRPLGHLSSTRNIHCVPSVIQWVNPDECTLHEARAQGASPSISAKGNPGHTGCLRRISGATSSRPNRAGTATQDG